MSFETKKCVIYKNEAQKKDGFSVIVPSTLKELIEDASSKLGINGIKLYGENGGIISNVSDIENNEILYLSCGESFYKTDNARIPIYKIAVLGSGGVGKSCLSLRYVKSRFVDVYDPTIEDAFRLQTIIDGNSCIIDILDTAGQDDMEMLRRQWIEEREGFLLVFSLVDNKSLEDLEDFFDIISQVKEEQDRKTDFPIVLVGNKKDLESKQHIGADLIKEKAEKYHATYVETSAKTGEGVNNAFIELIRRFVTLAPEVPPKPKKKLCILL